jgi:N-acylneuraminate cytidylyltransferase/CMP-N,N'-diacetyllegionaminic acid synthase
MGGGMKRLAVICARGGSKGVKGKNLRQLGGKPLLAHTVEQARACGLFDAIAISSDSAQIRDTAIEYGADHAVERPADLASDTAPKVPAIRHCAETIEHIVGHPFDVVVDLDATAPLRNTSDIRGVLELLDESGADNVVSGMPARRSPYFNLVERDGSGRVRLSKTPATPIARRQDAPDCFDLNASVFAWTRAALFSDNDYVIGDDTCIFVMPEERSIDIDTETDFKFVEFLMAQNGNAR